LLTLSGKKVLVEISFIAPPLRLHETLFKLQVKGYEPVLAHPERYKFYHDDFSQYERIHEMGCRLQVNMLSLAGYYGKSTAKAAFRLIEKKLPAYLGTDLHHEKHLEALRRLGNDQRLLRQLRQYPWCNGEL
jgi:tyrosine-protein phosphatase YwqE